MIRGFHPDPSICRVGDSFFLVTSSFEYYPGIPLFHSRDLVNWTQIGHVLDRPSQLDLSEAPASGGIFAPTIRHHEGMFFVTSTNVSGSGHFIVHSRDPWAGWSEPVHVDQSGIDPSLYFEDGRVLFTSNIEADPSGPHELNPDFTRGIQQSEIDPFTGAMLVAPRLIWEGTGASYPEGPHLYKRGSFYYLVIAEGGTEWGHFASVGRSRSPWGPFEASPRGPFIDHRSRRTLLRSVGHADLVQLDDDEWWAVCLGIRADGGWPTHVLGRETFLTPVTWDQQGWPQAGDAGVVQAVERTPPVGHRVVQESPKPFHDDFSAAAVRPQWQYVRAPQHTMTIDGPQPGLSLARAGSTVSDREPVFVGYRLQDHHFEVRVLLELEQLLDGESAGVAVRMNEGYSYSLNIRAAPSALTVSVQQRLGTTSVETPLCVISPGRVEVAAHAEGDLLQFSVRAGRADWCDAPPLQLRLISTEVAGGFTGAFIGPYVAGAQSMERPLRVLSFDYSSTATGQERETAHPDVVALAGSR